MGSTVPLAGTDREILLHLLPLAAAERRVRQHHVEPVLVLHVGDVLAQRVRVGDVRRLDPVQDHVHDPDDVGERLLLLAVERLLLERLHVLRRQVRLRPQVLERLAQEPRRPDRPVVDALADLRLHDPHDGADERARRVVLAAVPPGVAHVLDLGFVQVAQLVLLGLRPEPQLVDVVDDVAEVVPALDLVFDLAEDLADLVLDGVRPARLLLEVVQVREQLLVHEVPQVVAAERLVVVDLPALVLRRGPTLPAVRLVEDEGVLLALQRRLVRPVLFQPVEVLQEEEPRRLLGVVELGRAAGFFPKRVVDVLERLLEHGANPVWSRGRRGAGHTQSRLLESVAGK
ncbi:hypothetical protein ETAA1_26160 [Urbifossiella limnaea]|uniref:Uncharacterized protein n=1 Tax=Urbifossiella limnaea TaxID=2528023 RepID=A0A517XT03_9BACT|nr:hypothetical protein ETAA1_26160 [Urbifossiella limnaea]